jgi:hypothetical protein
VHANTSTRVHSQAYESSDCKPADELPATGNETMCTEIDFYVLTFYTCPLWIFLCALMLIEYFHVQLGSLTPVGAFENWSHYTIVIVGAVAIFLPTPSLYYWVVGKEVGDICPEQHDCLASVLLLYMSSLAAGLIPLLSLAAHLLWKHYKETKGSSDQTTPKASSGGAGSDRSAETQAFIQVQSASPTESSEPTKAFLQVQSVFATVDRLYKLRGRASKNYKAHVVGFVYWSAGMVLFVVNWMLLIIFSVTYIKYANCNLAIFFAVLIFNTFTGFMHTLVCRVMENAEQARIGSKNAGFDRFHLVGLTRIAFHLYTAIFRLTLLVRLENWSNFAVFYVTTSVPTLLHIVVPVNGKLHSLATGSKSMETDRLKPQGRNRKPARSPARGASPPLYAQEPSEDAKTVAVQPPAFNNSNSGVANANADEGGQDTEGQSNEPRTCVDYVQAVTRHTVKPDLLHQRGVSCFNAYLRSSASHIATGWYCTFVLCMQLMPNRELFPHYSTQPADIRRQIAFAVCAWVVDYLAYTMLNVIFDRRYNLSPTYVGLCYLREYPRFRYSVVFIAAHIISDVYLSLTFASMAGVDLGYSPEDNSGLC